MSDDLALEICDVNFDPLFLTSRVVRASTTKELGAVGEGSVTIPIDDEAILYIPDSNSPESNEARWRLYEAGKLVFAGVVDQTTRTLNEDLTYSFGGKQRGILLGTKNVGRRDFNAWPVHELFKELLRDNVGKAPYATVKSYSSQAATHPAISAITGDPFYNSYWSSHISGTNHQMVIDLGAQVDINGIRVIPVWWDKRWYKFQIATSPDNSAWTGRGSYTEELALSDRGRFFNFNATARYVRVTVNESSDQIGRIAAVLTYRNVATVGADTNYALSWIENDDSGNVLSGSLGTARAIENGAFNGDGILGNSLVTRLSTDGALVHQFRGPSNSVYFTQGTTGGNAVVDIYVDSDPPVTVALSGSTWQTKGYEITGLDFDDPFDDLHELTVEQVSGTAQVDYFTGEYISSFRPIRDDDPSVAYTGTGWKQIENIAFNNFTAMMTQVTGNAVSFEFSGDLIQVIGSKGPDYGSIDIYIDGALEISGVDLSNGSEIHNKILQEVTLDYDDHVITVVNAENAKFVFDGFRGNMSHIIYMRSFYETNLRLLTRLSEITNSWLRFNDDGSVDLLGSVGEASHTIIREGENEGGTIINATVEDDYSETASAVLALVTGPDDLPVKAFVVDRNAVARMGLKVRKMENADAQDAYLLTRQAWTELREHLEPQSRYQIQFDPSEVGDIVEGQTTVLYSPRLKLAGDRNYRVGQITTEWS